MTRRRVDCKEIENPRETLLDSAWKVRDVNV